MALEKKAKKLSSSPRLVTTVPECPSISRRRIEL